MNNTSNTAILLMHCPDQKGIISYTTQFIHENQGNIVYLDQYVDRDEDRFYMRVEFELDSFLIPKEKIKDYFNTLLAQKYNMTFHLHFSDKVPNMALFVTKMSHCLYDILSRADSGELKVNIPMIVSNHETLKKVADKFDIPFYHFKVNKENKAEIEAEQIKLMKEKNIDFIVLARYMQILSENFIETFPDKIINIHHSFLPAFVGAKPYHAAHERGVKIIGATSHYVTTDLDAGPIIEQDVSKVSHKDTVKELIRKGKDLEKIVLSRAIYKHVNRKLLTYKNKTIIFD
ncbi:formyltetrahydrofolate deformylase [Flammeovirga yaeyamensis]|uniref:Formyltetrahydrofolate deformylase n=1 Tax=Flammeovirga yaeyamensis TaxID=367791 RepID=A0AAX1MXN8_9BACT|nr:MULTISPECIES: formyltetrahydrofolate deformylase [Flammeovirga]ANQ48523.1 formyltetrahydrofolate deformylase [Flammeovirga sp. MY04]MBB3696416.1 formyltetrahydrofolate deformylase [Flammeovirga yaeyamensis]NMF35095.1 formyltetrahydrofolate deformylase [Flammeovirga yaeyamensis]QWG00084.1 formyltetrahydrofolate deformylase [Flammeovirga yaeyamensis]